MNSTVDKVILLSILIIFTAPVYGQDYEKRLKQYDILSYDFDVTLSEESDEVSGTAKIEVRFISAPKTLELDLSGQQADGTGMTITGLSIDGEEHTFEHRGEIVSIDMRGYSKDVHFIQISYRGIPTDGLIIRTDTNGNKTFFGDHWPNRAHNWIPCNDHSSDKARVSWTVTAPRKFQVVGTGAFAGRSETGDMATTRWASDVPLPPKVFVIGVADFTVEETGVIDGTPVSSWVYTRDAAFGFSNYAMAPSVLQWFLEKIGPYPFEKLANVQSTTMFGGMENAGNIFYYEESVQPGRDVEGLLAHEIAHQWYGNSVTEIDWAHLWLSEGFATYLTNLYMEDKYGYEPVKERLAIQRGTVLAFSRTNQRPVIDEKTTDYMQLLNANSYQKGCWVLHMLREEVGDEAFWLGLQQYYERYRDANATTADFRMVMEATSGTNLKGFFKQWLYAPGHPKLTVDWFQSDGQIALEIYQTQKSKFKFPLQLRLESSDGSDQIVSTQIKGRKTKLTVDSDKELTRLVIDPNVKLLWEPSGN